MRAPCKGCEKREPGCHDRCEVYQEWIAAKRADHADMIEKTQFRSMGERSKREYWRHMRYGARKGGK